MTRDVQIGQAMSERLESHPERDAVLDEVHARPFTPLASPARVLLFGFQTEGETAHTDRRAVVRLCQAHGCDPPRDGVKHHRVRFGPVTLRWEQHTEFTTYTWELPADPEASPFEPSASTLSSVMSKIRQPGPLVAAIDLHLVPHEEGALELFDPASVAAAETSDRTALYATDFQPDEGGFVRILVLDRGLRAERAGALVQRLLELETYRMFALRGLPTAQRLTPSIGRIEKRLAELAAQMCRAKTLDDNRGLLDELTALAAELEAGAVASMYRFGASRAYDEIVRARLEVIGEREVGGMPTWTAFLARRMAPAMRTCVTTEERQATLSRKLARGATLLRARVDVALAQQNQELLQAMNARTRLHLRLQTTVEELSVAAITYYVVNLLGYVVKAAHESHVLGVEPAYVTAAIVPVAGATIWQVVRRIRKKHVDDP